MKKLTACFKMVSVNHCEMDGNSSILDIGEYVTVLRFDQWSD